MKNLFEYITEAGFKPVKKVQPKTKEELKKIIKDTIKVQRNKANLNFIDTSEITDMSELFQESKFNGDISEWDVSNVKDMSFMFCNSKFNGDISKWDVSNVKDMRYMFANSVFVGDISKWDISNVTTMSNMFDSSVFNGDISKWKTSNVKNMSELFVSSVFNGDISKWDISNVTDMRYMFYRSAFNRDISSWNISVNKCKTDKMFDNSAIRSNYKPNQNDIIEPAHKTLVNNTTVKNTTTVKNNTTAKKTKSKIVEAKSKDDLVGLIRWTMHANGNKADLNFIDTSKITDMDNLFSTKYGLQAFNGDISKWNVSNVIRMNCMFQDSQFNGDISKWKVSNVKYMRSMFESSQFTGNISKWDVSNVRDHDYMFYDCKISLMHKPNFD